MNLQANSTKSNGLYKKRMDGWMDENLLGRSFQSEKWVDRKEE